MDFSLILFIALVATGLIWLWDRLIGARRRAAVASSAGTGEGSVISRTSAGSAATPKEPWLVEYARAFFPVILLVFLLRSFVVEPFRIPSGSMLPSLHVGDFILVNKFSYGIRLPIVNRKMMDTGRPGHGDVMVFRFPHDESVNFIKRVVGLPGDNIIYEDKTLYINGARIPQTLVGDYAFKEAGKRNVDAERLSETLGTQSHDILSDKNKSMRRMEFSVPEDHYFVMGDNRDYSNDSRFWGFVPESHIVGKAFFIWFSWDSANGGGVNWGRIAHTIR